MGVTEYSRKFNFTLALVVLYNVLCLADVVIGLPILDSIISKTAIIYLVLAIALLVYKIQLTRKYFLGRYALNNLIAHGVLIGVSAFLMII